MRPKKYGPPCATLQGVEVKVSCEASLDDMLEAFETFLVACGYVIGNKHLELVDQPTVEEEC